MARGFLVFGRFAGVNFTFCASSGIRDRASKFLAVRVRVLLRLGKPAATVFEGGSCGAFFGFFFVAFFSIGPSVVRCHSIEDGGVVIGKFFWS